MDDLQRSGIYAEQLIAGEQLPVAISTPKVISWRMETDEL